MRTDPAAARTLRAALVAALAVIGMLGCERSPGSVALELPQAELSVGESDVPPARDDAVWTRVSLPDRWRLPRRQQALGGWYRLQFPGPAGRQPQAQAVYLPSAPADMEVWLNGVRVGDNGAFGIPQGHVAGLPYLQILPAPLLAADGNELAVRWAIPLGHSHGLSRVFVGPARELSAVYEERLLLNNKLPQALNLTSLAVGLLFLIAYRGADPWRASPWLSGGLILWAAGALLGQLSELPAPYRFWDAVTAACTTWWMPAMMVAMHRILERPRPTVERLIFGIWIVFSVAAFALPNDVYRQTVENSWLLMAFPLGGYMGLALIRVGRSGVVRRAWGLLIAPVVIAVAVAQTTIELRTGWNPLPFEFGRYMLPAVAASLGWLLIARMRDAYYEALDLNRDLEQRVAEKHAELEENYSRLRSFERDHAVALERDRIMQDVHDGMGGQLVSTLALVESGNSSPEEVAEAIRDALDDMRLMLDSLDRGLNDDLPAVLGLARERLQPRLERAGIRFDWKISPLPPQRGLGSEQVLHVLRIVQESITNAVKHASATTIRVSTGVATQPDEEVHAGETGVEVVVSDNGSGIPVSPRMGRGLANMQRRARSVGGQLTIETGRQGTQVRLWIPVAPVDDSSSDSQHGET